MLEYIRYIEKKLVFDAQILIMNIHKNEKEEAYNAILKYENNPNAN
jgi:hypothetical protein